MRLTTAVTVCLIGVPMTACVSTSTVVHRRTTAIHLPVERQESNDLCGVAAISMVARYYNHPLPYHIRRSLKQIGLDRRGISGRELKAALEESGFSVYVFAGVLDSGPTGLFLHLDRGRPLVAMYSDAAGEGGHYVVLIGYDERYGRLLVVDPLRGKREIELHKFEQRWSNAARFTLLAVPKTTSQ